ncbi:low affinity iron permease family protein [Sphingobium sp. Sx8-8]|uniref:low affinity iron permease family protein n=1 Tax=Sphingobium sp. Sx8-8 TaxID=2933617 RepID=UPI001F5853C2|nr:low affinity iron permease family protein [Sphingobium sp. Sx8-8]
MDRIFTFIATRIAAAAGQPITFALALGIILIWGITGPMFGYSDTWQLIINTGTTIITFLMVFLIQNSQNRDAAAMQAKLDEVIRALDSAREQFIGIEHRTAKEVEDIRAALEREVGSADGKAGTADDSVERIIERS